MQTSFRRALGADSAALAAFAERTFRDTYEAYNTPEDMRDYVPRAFNVAQQERELSDPAMITVVAEASGDLVGYAQLKRARPPAFPVSEHPVEIYRFYVDRAAHGTGVAQQLMAKALEAARDLGGDAVWLGVWERNPRAIAFYLKCGFREIGTQFFQLGADRQRDYVLVRPISGETA